MSDELSKRAQSWLDVNPEVKAYVDALRTALKEARRELNETWTDEQENVWRRPTAWAYAQSCRVREEQRLRAESAERRLRLMSERAGDAEAALKEARRERDEAKQTVVEAVERAFAKYKELERKLTLDITDMSAALSLECTAKYAAMEESNKRLARALAAERQRDELQQRLEHSAGGK